MRAKIQLHNMDCMEALREMEDNQFDLAIVDPPYGLNIAKEKPRKSGRWNFIPKQWDSARPEPEYFAELMRVSKEQVIWGGNYFLEHLGSSRGMIYWYKHQPVPNFESGEMAWVSMDRNSKCFDFPYYGGIEGKTSCKGRIHPTQKPVDLYKWLLENYAEKGQTILDTHLGSGSIAIACWDLGFDLCGYELDADYYKAALNRLEEHKKQGQFAFA